MRAFLFFLLIFFSVFCAKAQEGGYFLTHYASTDSEINNANFDITQNGRGVICIANRSGVIQFDGKNWEKLNTPTAIFSIAIDENNTIYTAGIEGFGRIGTSREHYLEYIPLTDSTASDIFDLILVDGKLYGINASTLFIYNIKDRSLKKVPSNYSGELLKLIEINDQIYVSTRISGLMLVGSDGFVSPNNILVDKKVEFASQKGSSNTYLIGLSNNEVAILSNGQFKKLNLDSEYLNANLIIDGTWINESLVAIATLRGGVVFVDTHKEEIEQVINYQNGLPDNEVLAISLDKHKGLWVAHSKGFTRISPEFPFRAFDRYEGLEGDMLSALYHNNMLYVGTTLGLYYLEEVKEFEETTTIEKRMVKVDDTQPAMGEKEKERKGLFGFLKRNKQQEEAPRTTYKTQYFQQVNKELQGIRYEYKKVDKINSKVFHLNAWGNRLYSGGLDGLFEIENETAKRITQAPVRSFYTSLHYNKLFINTYNDRFEVYEMEGDSYSKTSLLEDYRDWVSYIFEDNKNRVWFCSNNELYWVKLAQGEITDTGEHYISNPYFYNTYGVSSHDSVYFVNESGIYVLNEKSNKLEKTDQQPQEKYIQDSNRKIWILSNEKWQTLGANVDVSQLNILSVFTDISHISYDQSQQNFSVLTNNGHLYKLTSHEDFNSALTGYDPFLKNIRANNQIFLPERNLKFSQDNSALTFEFVQPEYSGVLNIEFQYMLEGLNDQWSEWSTSYNTISIPYLPDGKYKLRMRSKNVITGIKEIEAIDFKIVPPYWKRPWFLALEFVALASILFLSLRLKYMGYKYRMMSRLLALLTLIIIIEFIQTVAENRFGTETSPVIDFIIQIIVAIIILPVEGLLRRYIFREKNVQILDFISLKNKKR